MSFQPATSGKRSSSCSKGQEPEASARVPATMLCQPTTCGKRATSCCRGQEQETGAQIPTEQTVACQDLDETTTVTFAPTVTGIESKEVDTQYKAQPEIDSEGDHSIEAEPASELEKKKRRDEILTEVGGACTTGDGEYDDIIDEYGMSIMPREPTDGRPMLSAGSGKATDAPKKDCCCGH